MWSSWLREFRFVFSEWMVESPGRLHTGMRLQCPHLLLKNQDLILLLHIGMYHCTYVVSVHGSVDEPPTRSLRFRIHIIQISDFRYHSPRLKIRLSMINVDFAQHGVISLSSTYLASFSTVTVLEESILFSQSTPQSRAHPLA